MPTFADFVRAQRKALPIVPTESQVIGGTYIVTGSNTGLGYECAKHFVELGAARVIIAVRSPQKGNEALERMKEATGRHGVGEVWELDLASLSSVERFCEKIETLNRLDALVANASVALGEFSLTEGTETSMLVNVIATTLLAVRTLPKLQQSAKKFDIQPHLVVVSSIVAFDTKREMDKIEQRDENIFDSMGNKENLDMSQQ